MRQKLITLDPTSWDLAAKKPNFSQWVRDNLRSEDNKRKESQQRTVLWCRACRGRPRKKGEAYCRSCQIDLGIIELGYVSKGSEEE